MITLRALVAAKYEEMVTTNEDIRNRGPCTGFLGPIMFVGNLETRLGS